MSTPSQHSRLELVSLEQAQGELAEILASALTVNGKPLNIFAALAHHPKLLKRFNLLGGLLLNKGLLPAREREIVVLRIGWKAGSEYEFGQHTIIGLRSGLIQEEVVALTKSRDEYAWSPNDQVLIRMADELSDEDCVGDSTWAALRRRWTTPQVVELLILAGYYRLVAGFLNSTAVPLDDGVPGFPAG
jgi:4-carboxymuconolactone decarboxylase